MRRPALTFGLLAALAVYAGLAIASGLDRASAKSVVLAANIPGFLAATALRTRVADQLVGQDRAGTLILAQQAVRADPINAGSLGLLGAALLGAGQNEQANRTFRVAGALGWREPITQLYWMDTALGSGETGLAAQRVDAILRQQPDFPSRDMLLAKFESNPAGQIALVQRLAARPSWDGAYLGHAADLSNAQLSARAEVMTRLTAHPWGCEPVAPLVNLLALRKLTSAAAAVWRGHCPLAAKDGVADPHFAHLSPTQRITPFEWNLVGDGDVSAMAASQGDGLEVQVDGPIAKPVAWQVLLLGPGRYQLGWVAQRDGRPDSSAAFSLGCDLQDRVRIAGRLVDAKVGRFVGDVTADGSCVARFLTLWALPGPGQLRIDQVEISRP